MVALWIDNGTGPVRNPALSDAEFSAGVAEMTLANITSAVEQHLDAAARSKSYDSILSCCSYAASTNPQFRAEGLAAIAWRDAVWAHCYAVLADCQAGRRVAPTVAELIAELPKISW